MKNQLNEKIFINLIQGTSSDITSSKERLSLAVMHGAYSGI